MIYTILRILLHNSFTSFRLAASARGIKWCADTLCAGFFARILHTIAVFHVNTHYVYSNFIIGYRNIGSVIRSLLQKCNVAKSAAMQD